jgi:TolB-like protein/DNA-binding winged helix-turn-helix (wHTH) protein
MAKQNKAFEFGPFRLEVRERRLTREGHAVALRGRVFDTLYALISRHGCLVTKDELMGAVWPDSVVEETNLNHNICVLRRALGEKATGQKYVETVPRQGYRFVAEVKELDNPDERFPPHGWKTVGPELHIPESLPAVILAPSDPASPKEPAYGRKPLPLASSRPDRPPQRMISLLAVSVLFVAVYFGIEQLDFKPGSSDSRLMFAVLPFENLTGDSRQNYIADGFTREIVSQLGRWNIARIGVIAHTSTTVHPGTSRSIAEFGRELGVNYLVEGSMRRQGDRYRITVMLIRVDNQAYVWAANYSRALDEATAVQIEIARVVVNQIGRSIGVEPDGNYLIGSLQSLDALSLCSRQSARLARPEDRPSVIARPATAER